MLEPTLQDYVLRTRTVKEEEFHQRISELEGLVIVGAHGKNAQVKYQGSVEELYQALGYSEKEVIIEPLRNIPLPTQPGPVISKKDSE